MKVDVVLLPKDLTEDHLRDRAVVVFDVLRATTTMTAALASGAKEIRVFADLDAAREAAGKFNQPRLLCGEVRCLPPRGFDLGNSPGAYTPDLVRDKTLFMSTTNGTRAIAAATEAKKLFLGALVNASAVAETLVHEKLDAILLCAGTDGAIALEDMLGAGAVIHELLFRAPLQLDSDSAQIAQRMFDACRSSLLDDLGNAAGGRNILAAGLPQDIDFAARMNVFHVVGEVAPRELIVRGQQKM